MIYRILEYNIILTIIERTGRKPRCIRGQIIGIAMVLEHDFNNVTWVGSSVTCMHCKGFLETWLTFEVPTSFINLLFSVVICLVLCIFVSR